MENINEYTGREIAIFTDCHGLLEPTIAILEDIKNKNITEIYSLGDAIGFGPNPSQVLSLLNQYDVKQINGNSEEYSILGIEPFLAYFTYEKRRNQEWTKDQLTKEQIEKLRKNKHSYDLSVGKMKIGLCHFANDVRIDFLKNSTWSYQNSINSENDNPQEQFYFTNSEEQKRQIKEYGSDTDKKSKGFVSAKEDTIFNGKQIDEYDEIIQGHVHFKFLTEDDKVRVRTIRAVGMAYGENEPLDFASYIIIKEKNYGYDVEEVLVPFNRTLMLKSIDESTLPDKASINKFIGRR